MACGRRRGACCARSCTPPATSACSGSPLFCGFERRGADLPVHYPVACPPQAWASGALVHVFLSMLGFRPRAFEQKLHLESPALPETMTFARLENLRVGRPRVTIRFVRRGRHTSAHVHGIEGEPVDVTVRFC